MEKSSFKTTNVPELWNESKYRPISFYLDPKVQPTENNDLKEFVPFEADIIYTTFGAFFTLAIIIGIYVQSGDLLSLIFAVVPLVFTFIAFFKWKKFLFPRKLTVNFNAEKEIEIIGTKGESFAICEVKGIMALNFKEVKKDFDSGNEILKGCYIFICDGQDKWCRLFESSAENIFSWSLFIADNLKIPLRIDRLDIDNTVPLVNRREVIQKEVTSLKNNKSSIIKNVFEAVDKVVPYHMLDSPVYRECVIWEHEYFESLDNEQPNHNLLVDLAVYESTVIRVPVIKRINDNLVVKDYIHGEGQSFSDRFFSFKNLALAFSLIIGFISLFFYFIINNTTSRFIVIFSLFLLLVTTLILLFRSMVLSKKNRLLIDLENECVVITKRTNKKILELPFSALNGFHLHERKLFMITALNEQYSILNVKHTELTQEELEDLGREMAKLCGVKFINTTVSNQDIITYSELKRNLRKAGNILEFVLDLFS